MRFGYGSHYDGCCESQCCHHHYERCCDDVPQFPCRPVKECVKTYKTCYKLYKICHFRLFKVCSRCGHEYDFHFSRGCCPRCR